MASVQHADPDGRLGTPTKTHVLSQWHDIALVCAGAVIVLGFAVLAGWGLNITALRSVLDDATPMWPATAALIILSGVALALASWPGRYRPLSVLPAALVVVASFIALAGLAAQITVGYESWLFPLQVQSTGLPFAGRPAMLTAIGLIIFNAGILLLNARRYILAQQLAALGILLAWIAFTGYVFSVSNLYGSRASGHIAINTAIGFLLLGCGIFTAQPDAGVMRLISRDSLSRPTLLRLWFFSLALTFLLGWASSIAQSMSGASPAQVLALFVAGNAVIITVLIGWSAVALQRMELARQFAMDRVLASQAHLHNLQVITASLSSVNTVKDAATVIAKEGLQAIGAQAVIAALLNADGKSLDIIHSMGYPQEVVQPWRHFPIADKTPMGEVISQRQLLLIESREQAMRDYPTLSTERGQYQAWAVMPLIHDSKVVGAIDFAFTEARCFTPEDKAFLMSVSEQCAQAMARARLYEAAQQKAKAANILATISQALTRAHTLDERVAALVNLIVPELADWCTVNFLQPDGRLQLIGVAHAEPGKADWIRAWAEQHPININSQRVRGVLDDHNVTYIDHMTESIRLQMAGEDEDALHWLRESNTGSMVEVALSSNNMTFGFLKLVRSQSSPAYTSEDVALIRDVAQHAAWALDNAQLFQAAMTSSRIAERNAERTQRLQTVTALMNTAQTISQVTEAMVNQGIEAMGARAGFITLFAEQKDGSIDHEWLSIVAQHGYDVDGAESSILPTSNFPVAATTPVNLAVQEGEPVWIESVGELFKRFPAAARLLAQRDQAWACVPLDYEQTVLGGLALSFEQPRKFDDDDKALFIALARQCAQALERARLLTTEQKLNADLKTALTQVVHDEHVQRLLARAGALLASPLDVTQRLESAAKLFVEQMADWCTIEIIDEHGRLSQQAVAHADSSKQPSLLRLRNDFPPVTDSDAGISKVMKTREPLLYAVIDPSVLKSMSRNEAHAALLRDLGCHSGMILPLCANGKMLGTMSFMRCDDSPEYTLNDLAVTTDLAIRVGMAIENARLFEETNTLNQRLEMRVAERTAELERSNEQLRESRERLRELSRQTLSMVEKERAQVVREVHDELGQLLASVKMSLALAQRQLSNDHPAGDASRDGKTAAGDSINSALEMIDNTIQSIRSLAANLRPVVLDDLGLVAAIEWQVQEFEHKTGIYCDFSSNVEAGVTFSQEISTAAFRILQEALNNVSRHAQASEVWVTLVANSSGMMLNIRDNGQGMKLVEPTKTYGLLSMHERALQLNGQLDIQSAPNQGTAIVLMVPFENEMQKIKQ